MTSILSELRLATAAPIQLIDVTEQVRVLLEASGVRNGLLTVISGHTTAFVAINELEPHLQADMVDFLTRIAPPGADYGHDRAPVDDRPNAHAHLAGLFMNASESIPIVDGRLVLGAWQSILFVELDGPREARSVNVHILGEA
jgi:secondary thiamine-phosphate synthase enzyme